ncbi:MAG: MaoC/PaaZ C-terminal domain-containing protein [Schaedlerella sp.]|nr:MaoC/PaaZ C-terminal domain-containing protein [Schaedlerella sp.]
MYFDEVELNMTVDIPPAVIEKDEMLAFARRFDYIPIHTDEEFAKSTHFGSLIAPGMMTFLVIWSKYLEKDLFRDELLAGKSTSMEWHKPVFAGDVLKATAVISNLTKRNSKNGIVEFTIKVYNQNGEHVLTDVTEVIVKCKPGGIDGAL